MDIARASIVVAVKSISSSKSRMRAVLEDTARIELVTAMYLDTLAQVELTRNFGNVLVAAGDDAAVKIAHSRRFEALEDKPNSSLNRSLERALDVQRSRGASMALVLPIDLPYLVAGDLDALIASHPANGVTVCQARRDAGTTIIIAPLAELMPLAFGLPRSALEHQKLGHERRWTVRLIDQTPFDFDIDTPDDLLALDIARCGPRVRAVLKNWQLSCKLRSR